jgi:Acetyltransferase (GNAT) domain
VGQVFRAVTVEIGDCILSATQTIDAPKTITLFSQARFVEAVVRSSNYDLAVKLRGRGAQSEAFVCGVELHHSLGRRSFSFAPFGLYAYPSVLDGLGACIRDFIAQLTTLRTTSFEWNVRYDHADLANELQDCGIPYSQSTTHLLKLGRDYESVFGDFNATIRNQVRRAHREGVVVRRADEPEAMTAYYQLYRAQFEKNGLEVAYGRALFDELLRLREDVVFLVAEVGDSIVAGGLFFRDGNAMFYWHGALNREYSRYYPACAILDHAIRLACDEGMATFNLGGSVGIASLEQFKSFWGAQKVPCWQFSWDNPFWSSMHRLKQAWRSHA